MATVNTQVVSLTGIAPTYNAASAGGDKFSPGERTYLHVKNTNAATRDANVVTPNTVRGLAIGDVVVTVPATTGERLIGPFPPGDFAGTDGLVAVTWTPAETGVTFAVVSLP